MKKLKKKIIDVTSDVLSAPARFRANQKIKTANFETKVLQESRKLKEENAPRFDKNGNRTKWGEIMDTADFIKYKYKRK